MFTRNSNIIKIKFISGILLSSILVGCGSGRNVSEPARPTSGIILDFPSELSKPKTVQITPKVNKTVTTPKNTEDYILKFAPIAIKEMKDYKIPASITLAQGILESGSGRSPLAVRSNNHFGIKCHKGWDGKSVTHDDDSRAECFRKYKYPESSYEDHSKFLYGRKRYAHLFKLKTTDYKGWAYGLRRAGYATDPRYPQKLIGLINRYNLNQYDTVSLASTSHTTTKPTTDLGMGTVKGATYVVVKGDTLYSIARRYKISVQDLKKKNNLAGNSLSIGQQLIIQ